MQNFLLRRHVSYIPVQQRYQISEIESDIIESIKSKAITIVSSPTGSGKSTQIPQYLARLNYKVICTQPRKIACESLSNFIISQTQNKYIIKANDEYHYYHKDFDILFIRENTLLSILSKDPFLYNIEALVIDEVHERSMVLDLILFYLKHYTINRGGNTLKLIITSATIDVNNIVKYFSDIIKEDSIGIIMQDFNSNYDIVYKPLHEDIDKESEGAPIVKFDQRNIKYLIKLLCSIIKNELYYNYYKLTRNLTILVFLPDFKTIYNTEKALNYELGNTVSIVQFFGSLKHDEQVNRLRFNDPLYDKSGPKATIILSTTLAETCLTIPDCEIVIDTGVRKYNKYNYETNLYQEYIDYISQDTAIQRAGRCGRDKTIKGKCYRLFTKNTYEAMRKHRIPEVGMVNIDLIILRIFDSVLDTNKIIQSVKEIGYLDFLSKVNEDIFFLILQKLHENGCLDKTNGEKEVITQFGQWLSKIQLDFLSGKIIYNLEKQRELNKEIIQTLSLITQNQSCELFYANVNNNFFRLNFIDYDYNNEKEEDENLQELASSISKNLIDKATMKYSLNLHLDYSSFKGNPDKEYLYYSLFIELDKIYGSNNFYSKNKIFELGDLMIGLFYLRQYQFMKCTPHFLGFDKKKEKCYACCLSKYYYCMVYALNEKFFTTQQSKQYYIFNLLPINVRYKECLTIQKTEEKYAYWNKVYLNLISKRPFDYIKIEVVSKLLNDVKHINFDILLDELYQSYRRFYIELGKKIMPMIEDKIFFKKIFNINEEGDGGEKITLYYNVNQDGYERIKISKNYFFDYYENTSDKFFSLVQYSKLARPNIVNYKNINPILPEMLGYKNSRIKRKIEENFEKIKLIDIYTFKNIGKYFYYTFLENKFIDSLTEFSKNRLSFIFLEEKTRNEIVKLSRCIDKERNNFKKMTNNFQALNNGCLILKMSQGFNVINITTDKEEIIYEIESYFSDIKINISEIEEICQENEIKYKRIFPWGNKILISFHNDSELLSFLKISHQFIDLSITPYSMSKNLNNNTTKIYSASFHFNVNKQRFDVPNDIQYFLRSNNLDIKYYFAENNNNLVLYYYLHSNIVNDYYCFNNIQTILKGKPINEVEVFQINKNTFYSSPYFLKDFFEFVKSKKIYLSLLNFGLKLMLYKIDNYTPGNKEIIQQYLSETEIQLSSFAMYELKIKSKDTFLFTSRCQNLKEFGRRHSCTIEIVHFENKVIIYGAPKYRNEVKEIFSSYLERLNKEKRSKRLTNQQGLLFKSLMKVAMKEKFVIFQNKKNNQIKIEFREQYLEIINKILGKPTLIPNNINETIEMVQCEICLEDLNSYDKDINNVIQLKFCGHSFCVECLKMQISNQITNLNSFPLKCIKCGLCIANSDIQEIFSFKEMEKLSYHLIKNFIIRDKNKNFSWCQNPNCDYIYKVDTTNKGKGDTNQRVCPNCEKRFCLLCSQEIIDENEHAFNCRKKLLKKVDPLDRVWIMKNTRSCPLCSKPYEKTAGCNHMTCNYCKPPTEFCFICGKVLERGNPLKHFSDPKEKCCNRLYEDYKPEKEIEEKEIIREQKIEKEESDKDSEEEKKDNGKDNIKKEEEKEEEEDEDDDDDWEISKFLAQDLVIKKDKDEKEEDKEILKNNYNYNKNEKLTNGIIKDNKKESNEIKLKKNLQPSSKPKKQITPKSTIISRTKQTYKAKSNRIKNNKNIHQSKPIEIIEEEKYESSSDDIDSYLMSPGHNNSDSNSSYENSSSPEQTESESEDSISQYLII